MRSAFRFVSNSTLAAAATLVVVLAPAPASADLEADVKSCQARETPPKERLVVCQKIIDSDVLNQKQMVVALYAQVGRSGREFREGDQTSTKRTQSFRQPISGACPVTSL